MKNKKIVAVLIILLYETTLVAQTITPPDDYILDKMRQEKIPGVVTALIKDEKVAYTKGYGLADIEKDIPYTPNTIQGILTISNIVTATAIMKLWEQDEFELDDPINNYLPFPITNPFYPNTPITFRMLLCHTSSVNSDEYLSNGILNQLPTYYPPGTAPAMGPYLQSYYVPGGSLYTDSISYRRVEPGTVWEKSTNGFAILGYLVELISGQPFHEYCNENIFDPLCMNNTAWYYSELDSDLLATPYNPITSGNHATPFELYERVEYPAKGLKTTVADLSRFMQMHMNHGILDGVRIIETETEEMMRTPQILRLNNANLKVESCLGFFKVTEYNNNNTILFGHDGDGPGVVTHSFFSPTHNSIVTVLSNCNNSMNHINAILDIHLKIHLETAPTISTADKPILDCSYVLNPCPQNESYWETHQPDWPINSIPMKIGTKHYYAKNQILELLDAEPNGDASIVLGKALAIAKFNIAQASELSQILATINEAMAMIGDKRLPYDVPVPVFSATGIQMLSLAATLNSYNSGTLNENECSGTAMRSSSSLEIETNIDLNELKAWPNPAHSTAQISFSISKTGKISINLYDLSGTFINIVANRNFSEGTHQLTLDTKELRAGVYIIRLQTNESTRTKKIIVLR